VNTIIYYNALDCVLLRRRYVLEVWSLYKTSVRFRTHCTIKAYVWR